MHSAERVNGVLELARAGRGPSEVARLTGLPRSTVRDWLAGAVPRRHRAGGGGAVCPICEATDHRLSTLPAEYLYLLGLYLGDGCISAHPRGVYKLRIFLDAAYPGIIDECVAAIGLVSPRNRVRRLVQGGNFQNSGQSSTVEVISYSRSWPCLFPQHGPGRKHERVIALADWQSDLAARHLEQLLKGLIHSDGCRFINTGRNWRYPRYSFSNRSHDIRRVFCHACNLLGVHWTEARDTIYVSRKADVARLDEFIGPKA